MGPKSAFAADLPVRANATIRSRAGAWRQFSGIGTASSAPERVSICRKCETAMRRILGSPLTKRLRSLRLSVRTPPFHGGESGSIPLGSANAHDGDERRLPPASNDFRRGSMNLPAARRRPWSDVVSLLVAKRVLMPRFPLRYRGAHLPEIYPCSGATVSLA